MNNFDWFGLAAAITYAHVEAQGYKASRSECLIELALNTGGEGEASVASPSFQGSVIEDLVSTVERIQK